MDSKANANANNQAEISTKSQNHETGWSRYNRNRRCLYLGILIFVVIVGLPMAAVPSLRYRLKTRIETLRSAYLGEPAVQPPALARIGENHQPFPKEYERPLAQASFLPKIELPAPRQPYRITMGGGELTLPDTETEAKAGAGRPLRTSGAGAATTPPSSKAEPKPVSGMDASAAASTQAPAEPGTEPQYRKGKIEQEAYDLLVNANQTLAGMIKGSNATLKYQDWSAASVGENSYYVMVMFVQTADNVVRKYIWNVKVATKEVIPLSAYAMSISK